MKYLALAIFLSSSAAAWAADGDAGLPLRMSLDDEIPAKQDLETDPQRPQDSVGLVVEAARPHELDAFEWYCFECGELVHRIEVKVKHLVKDLPPLYEQFYNDPAARTCKQCGAMHPGRNPPAGWSRV